MCNGPKSDRIDWTDGSEFDFFELESDRKNSCPVRFLTRIFLLGFNFLTFISFKFFWPSNLFLVFYTNKNSVHFGPENSAFGPNRTRTRNPKFSWTGADRNFPVQYGLVLVQIPIWTHTHLLIVLFKVWNGNK